MSTILVLPCGVVAYNSAEGVHVPHSAAHLLLRQDAGQGGEMFGYLWGS